LIVHEHHWMICPSFAWNMHSFELHELHRTLMMERHELIMQSA
jgi:hypothetical protein